MNKELADKIIELFEDDALEIIEEGDWVSEGKQDICETIVKHEGKYYEITQSRSGSYYSDYYYDDPDVCEVVPKEITTTKWVKVKEETSETPARFL